MLNKATLRLSSINQVMRRSMITVPGKSWIQPEGVNDLVTYLDNRRPEYICLYFHAAWNPTCADIERDYDAFTARNSHFTHIKVDCDATPKLKFFFDARVEPQFLMLLNGAEIKRQIGFNFDLVEN